MRINKRLRKAFTLVELVVVIAIIAILSTVSVVTYFGITNSAKKSVDDQTITQWNQLLLLEEELGNKCETPSEAVEIIKENGWDVAKLTPTYEGNEILWNDTTNRFSIISKDTVNSLKRADNGDEKWHKWRFLDNYADNNGYSVYLRDQDFSGNLDLTITTGLDVGDNTEAFNITYNTTDAKTVSIRTNGGTLTVDSANSSVKHYGASDYSSILNVSSDAYREYGVSAYVRVANGSFVAESTAKVINLNVASSDVTITENSGATVAKYSKASDDVTVKVNGSEKEVNSVLTEDKIQEASKNSSVVAEGGVAEVNGIQSKSLSGALEIANDGDLVKLVSDDKVTSAVICNKNVIIDFNGYVLQNTIDIWNESNALFVINGSNVTLKDSSTNQNGGVIAKQDDCYAMAIKENGTLTIESGRFKGNISCVQIEEGHLSVNGGNFDLDQKWPSVGNGYDYTLNCIDASYKEGKASVEVSGGTFVGFDPSNNYAEGNGTTFLASGYKVESANHPTIDNLSIYTVVKA